MDLNKIKTGKNPPEEVNVVIEIQANSSPVKHEFDKESGALFVDRILSVAMYYPAHYGFIPKTISGDGDPADVLVITDAPIMPGVVIAARPIGVLLMEDEAGQDEKILAVPTTKISPSCTHIKSYKDLPQITLDKIKHFFERYKDLEQGKWVKVVGWEGAEKAKSLISEAIVRFEKSV